MTKSKNTKRALLASVLSLMLCAAMLVGSTFAWFTDSVTSGKNKIVAGNLDIELEYCLDPSAEGAEWKSVQDAEDIFGGITLWEPGTAGVVYFRLSNLGTLAFKYKLGMNFTDTVIGTSVMGNEIKLSEILEFGIVSEQAATFANREAAIKAVNGAKKLNAGYSEEQTMAVTDEKSYFALVVYMPTTVDNEANYRGDVVPSIDLGVTLFATQTPYENDSFGNDYDINAVNPDARVDELTRQGYAAVSTETAFKAAVTEGKSIVLNGNITLNGRNNLPENMVVDGNGYTITINTLNDLSGKNITIKNAAFKKGDTWGISTGSAIYENCVFEGISPYITPNTNLAITVKDCTFNNTMLQIAWSEGEKADPTSTVTTITGNIFNYTAGDDHGHAIALNTIGVSTDYSALTITGNTFNNKGVEACSALLIYNDDTNAVVLPTYSNNREVHATLGTNNNGTWNKVSKTDRAYVEMIFGDRVSYSNNDKLKSLSVATVDELMLLNDLDIAGVIAHNESYICNITITDDIDMSGVAWRSMNGHFVNIDGQGHTISNLTCMQGKSGKSGFVSYLGGGKITNLTLNNVTASGCQAGAFAGQVEGGTIDACALKGTVTITWEQCAGPYNETWNAIGALVGWNSNGTVGEVNTSGAAIKLVKGGMDDATVEDAKTYWTGTDLVGAYVK